MQTDNSPDSPIMHRASGVLIEEYKEIGANLRFYGNMRFAQLTLFAAIVGGLASVLARSGNEFSGTQELLLQLFGIVSILVIWIMEERSTTQWSMYYGRAREIESVLGLGQYSRRGKKVLLSATNAVRFLYALTLFAWACFVVADNADYIETQFGGIAEFIRSKEGS